MRLSSKSLDMQTWQTMNDSGMTLTELLVVIVVMAMMAVFAMPRLSALTNSNRLDALMADVANDIEFAMSEAMRRGHAVTICPATPTAECDRSGAWHDDWLVVANADGQDLPRSGARPLRHRRDWGQGVAIEARPRLHALTVDADGVFVGLPADARLVFTLPESSGRLMRCISFRNLSAEYTVSTKGQGSCV